MFHYEEKLKDLKVELKDNIYTIQYKDEKAVFSGIDLVSPKVTLIYHNLERKMSFDDAKFLVVGENDTFTGSLQREVWHFATPDGILPTLRCGVTEHKQGSSWSSTPHSFEDNPVDGFEEVFLYKLLYGKWSKNALQIGEGKWQDGSKIDSVWTVSDRDISAIPMGYHPVVGEPGVHVSYIWAYLAKHKEWEKI